MQSDAVGGDNADDDDEEEEEADDDVEEEEEEEEEMEEEKKGKTKADVGHLFQLSLIFLHLLLFQTYL